MTVRTDVGVRVGVVVRVTVTVGTVVTVWVTVTVRVGDEATVAVLAPRPRADATVLVRVGV
ncbi:MAG: hypothetical protein EB145_15555, partial [Proteobacteria bacterium]|nr:hypothetical protein [Pseudomonadota bacterium]